MVIPFIANPISCSLRYCMTPLLDSRPKALPPLNTTAWTSSTIFLGFNKSVSRVAGPPPRTSTPATAPSFEMMTVHPVAFVSSCACPT